MNRAALACVFAALLLSAGAGAADLASLDRTLLKEPKYQSTPRYGLLVFGPEAKTRVWLVQDGSTVYVDKNGNGDLTDPGEEFATEPREGADDGTYVFKIGDIRDGDRLHKDLILVVAKIDHLADLDEGVKRFLAKHPQGRGYGLRCEVDMPGWKGAGVGGRVQQTAIYRDAHGVLQFGERPREAPIVHFGGPWQVSLFSAHRLTAGRSSDVVLGVGTPGVGAGTTTYIAYAGVIPEKVFPTVEITYPPKETGAPPLVERYELKRRC